MRATQKGHGAMCGVDDSHATDWLGQVASADLRSPAGLDAAMEGVDAVCWAIGTTAFPSARSALLPCLVPDPKPQHALHHLVRLAISDRCMGRFMRTCSRV